MNSVSLGGRVVACLEARHSAELADLILRHGGIAYPAPCLREVHEPDAAETRKAVRLVCRGAVDAVVFLTGVGVQTIADAASHTAEYAEFLAGLKQTRIAVRGPKTLNAVRRLGAVADVIAPEPFTSDSLVEVIPRYWDVRGWHILVQCYGAPLPSFTGRLHELGASTVTEVSPYRWERPLDEDAVIRMVEDLAEGWIDVLAATSAAQVDRLFDIARDRGREAQLRTGLATPRLRVAAQGVVCASAFQRHGVKVDVVPPRASMGALILAVANAVGQDSRSRERPYHLDEKELVAMLIARSADLHGIARIVTQLSPSATLAVLSGKARRADRLAEEIAVQRGLAVHAVSPARSGRHPADTLVRRADRILVLSSDPADQDVAVMLRLAQRYAKPAQVVLTDSHHS